MNRGIILVLVGLIILGSAGLYIIQQGPVLFLRPPSEQRMAFVSTRGGNTDIWTMNTDGSDTKQVTNDAADDLTPSWSPDGRELVSVSDREEGIYSIYVSAWNGGYTRCMTTSAGTKDSPAWSNDGKEIVFLSGGKVYTMARQAGSEEQCLPPPDLSQVDLVGSAFGQPYAYGAWSPGRKYLLFMMSTDRGRESYAIERDQLAAAQSSEIIPMDIAVARSLDVAWSPKGQKVAAAFINRKGENGLLVSDLELLGSNDLFVSKGNGKGPTEPAWSPDGKHIAFEMWEIKDGVEEKNLGIWIIDASGGKPRQVAKGDAREPCWSLDGKYIAYAAIGEDGDRDIWRVNADGTGAVNLTEGQGDNYSPSWSPMLGKKS